MAITQFDQRVDQTPGANSEVSNSKTYTAGRLYVVFVNLGNTSSTQPDGSLSGWGTTWTDASPTNEAWDTAGASRRTVKTFWGVPPSSGTGVLTCDYTGSTVTEFCITVIESITHNDVHVVVDAPYNVCNAGTMEEWVTIPGTGITSSMRTICYVNTNVQVTATGRYELASDSGGEVNWTGFTAGTTSNSPVGDYHAGYYNGDPANDLNPGYYNNTSNPETYMVAVVAKTTSAALEQEAWIVNTSGTGGGDVYGSSLVPPTGAWLGAVTAQADTGNSSSSSGLTTWNSMTGIRPPDIIGIYKTGNWNGSFSAAEQTLLEDSGNGDPAIPHVRWKPDDDATEPWMQWADIANGNMDTELNTAFGNMASWGGKIFFTPWHEMEDNVPGMGSNQDYIDMWIHMKARAAANGADNLIWVLNFVGYRGHAVPHIVPITAGLANYIDWLAWDPYAAETASRDTLAELVNWDPNPQGWANVSPGYNGFYHWATSVYPGVPLMLAEFGVDGGSDSAHGIISASDAIPIIENWQDNLANFPAIKCLQYWHADGTGDYQITDRGGTGVTEFVAFTNDSHFDQDANVGYD